MIKALLRRQPRPKRDHTLLCDCRKCIRSQLNYVKELTKNGRRKKD